jgi:hypothetical protein
LTETPNVDSVRNLAGLVDETSQVIERLRASSLAEIDEIQKKFDVGLKEWQEAFEAAESKHQLMLAELDKDGVGRKALQAQLTSLRAQHRRLSNLSRFVDTEAGPRLKAIEDAREALLTTLGQHRRQIRDKRRAKAEEVSDRLNRNVVISITTEGDGRAQRDKLNTIKVGSRLNDQDIDAMVLHLHPIPLVRSLLGEDYDTLADLSGLSAHHFERLMETIREQGRLEELLDLQTVDREDVVKIRFQVENTYRDLEALAHGQKCTVVLMVAMAEGESPILVDQPEDALHAPWIEENIVSSLRADRDRRQCLFATRSANVLVSADAEQVIGMKSTADRGWVEETGGLDRFETRTLVLYHVEGGEGPFRRRHGKYAIG